MKCTRVKRGVRGESLMLLVLLLSVTWSLSAQEVDMEVVPPAQAQSMLKAIIPKGKKYVSFQAYVAGTQVKDVNLGLSCSSSSSGSTTGTVDDSGNIDARTQSYGSGRCRELHNYYKTIYLGLRDLADPQSSYMITAQCVEKWVWNHCDMPPQHEMYGVVLEIGKHDTFYVYAATQQKLGGKTKVAKFAVLDVTHVTPKDNNQTAAKADDKKN